MATDAVGVHRTECVTIAEEVESDDIADSAIDLTKEIEDLDKLQVGAQLSFEATKSVHLSFDASCLLAG